MLTKVCRDCGRELSLDMFYKNGTGYRHECKDCKKNELKKILKYMEEQIERQ